VPKITFAKEKIPSNKNCCSTGSQWRLTLLKGISLRKLAPTSLDMIITTWLS